jgi:hypothetical protein
VGIRQSIRTARWSRVTRPNSLTGGNDCSSVRSAQVGLTYNEAVTKRSSTLRNRYYVLVSVIYILIGLVVVVRSLIGHVAAIGLLGIVFIALGVVRMRDYVAFRREAPR